MKKIFLKTENLLKTDGKREEKKASKIFCKIVKKKKTDKKKMLKNLGKKFQK